MRTRSTRRRSNEGRDGAGLAGGPQGAASGGARARGARRAGGGAAPGAALGRRREGVQVRDRGGLEDAARALRGPLAAPHLPPDVRRGVAGGVPGLLVACRRAERGARSPERPRPDAALHVAGAAREAWGVQGTTRVDGAVGV